MTLPDRAIHELLRKFGPHILKLLASIEFFAIDGTYDALEIEQQIRTSPEWKRYQAASKEKNSRIWEIVGAAYILDAIVGGAGEVAKKYRLPVIPKPTAQDYMATYIKEHGGEYIGRKKIYDGVFVNQLSRADQKQIMKFIWANAGMNERPLAANILKTQPRLAYLVDNKRYRLEMIKRTEVHRAVNYGAQRFAKDSGFGKNTWYTAGDKRVRDAHKLNNNVTVEIGDKFPNGERYPSETSIRCRCHLSYS
ncbi:phage head morphogenesis protein [Candidatus Pacearchaeota archaeon]|jgi:hypothetical protein|nr:phage head morphogenesis protein [Candidatus Pacearchaeota archaeon]